MFQLLSQLSQLIKRNKHTSFTFSPFNFCIIIPFFFFPFFLISYNLISIKHTNTCIYIYIYNPIQSFSLWYHIFVQHQILFFNDHQKKPHESSSSFPLHFLLLLLLSLFLCFLIWTNYDFVNVCVELCLLTLNLLRNFVTQKN